MSAAISSDDLALAGWAAKELRRAAGVIRFSFMAQMYSPTEYFAVAQLIEDGLIRVTHEPWDPKESEQVDFEPGNAYISSEDTIYLRKERDSLLQTYNLVHEATHAVQDKDLADRVRLSQAGGAYRGPGWSAPRATAQLRRVRAPQTLVEVPAFIAEAIVNSFLWGGAQKAIEGHQDQVLNEYDQIVIEAWKIIAKHGLDERPGQIIAITTHDVRTLRKLCRRIGYKEIPYDGEDDGIAPRGCAACSCDKRAFSAMVQPRSEAS